MQILSRSHMENKCPCFLARRDGRVCAHAVAVGLEVIEPTVREGKRGEQEGREAKESVEDRWPTVTEEFSEDANVVRCRVMLPLKVEQSWEHGQLMVGIGVRQGRPILTREDRPMFTRHSRPSLPG
jgi:hypothetical protein